jgi:hypothetical protein
MTVVALRPSLLDQLRTEAERLRTSVDALVNDWLEDQLWRERHKKIYEEAERFRAKHAELLAQYAGRYVAMRDGAVIDHDPDLLALNRRIRERYGDEPILITPVIPEPIQTFKVLGARRRRRQS